MNKALVAAEMLRETCTERQEASLPMTMSPGKGQLRKLVRGYNTARLFQSKQQVTHTSPVASFVKGPVSTVSQFTSITFPGNCFAN